MHTGIILTVEADSATEAVRTVENFNQWAASWSDWSEHGGRWSDTVDGSVLRYSDNPEKFMELVKQFQGFTDATKQRYLRDIGDVTVRELATDPKFGILQPKIISSSGEKTEEERDEAMRNYLSRFWAKRLLDIVDGDFTCDQHFYDVDASSTSDEFLKERIANDPDKQFLVVWDYHH